MNKEMVLPSSVGRWCSSTILPSSPAKTLLNGKSPVHPLLSCKTQQQLRVGSTLTIVHLRLVHVPLVWIHMDTLWTELELETQQALKPLCHKGCISRSAARSARATQAVLLKLKACWRKCRWRIAAERYTQVVYRWRRQSSGESSFFLSRLWVNMN